jgi:acetyltransferase-like isoleucine patch superfamily enzyme
METIRYDTIQPYLNGLAYYPTNIGVGVWLGHFSVIRQGCEIGDNTRIYNNCTVDYGSKLGENCIIHCNCYIAQYTVIEDNVFLAPGVIIANDRYPLHPNNIEPATIKKGARIGCNATILPGVTIGEGALIGGGSVVSRDVPANKIAYGNPARVK